MVGAAAVILSEIEETGYKGLYTKIDSAKRQFLYHLEAMLQEPIPEKYSHRRDYSLTLADTLFLEGLLDDAKSADWRNVKEIEMLSAQIDAYARFDSL